LNYEKIGFIDRMLMKTVAKLMSKKKKKSDEERGFGQAIQESHDCGVLSSM